MFSSSAPYLSLSVASTAPESADRFAVLSSVSDDGAVACALLRLGGHDVG